jgi:hypothetical protein
MRRFAALAVVCLSSVAALNADVMVFDRGLPTANLNDAAGANRSNVAWADYTPYDRKSWAIGDDFNLGGAGSFTITDLRVWIVGSGANPLSDMWSDLTLFGGGNTVGTVNALSTVSTNGSDPNVVITPVQYAGGLDYQGSSGNMISFYQVDFLLDWTVDASQTYTFFVGGTPTLYNGRWGKPVSPFLHASNKDLSGSTQEGADNKMLELGWDAGGITDLNSWDSNGNGWDKSSDINVQILGTPEPGSLVLLGSIAGLLGLVVRKQVRQN